MFGRSVRCAVLVSVFTFFLMPVAVADQGLCGPQRVESFRLEVAATRPTVKAGDAITLTVKVWRSVQGKDLQAARDAKVVAAVNVGRVADAAGGTTAESGVATVRVQTSRNLGPGLADVWVHATSSPVHCVEEFGEVTKRALFKVVR